VTRLRFPTKKLWEVGKSIVERKEDTANVESGNISNKILHTKKPCRTCLFRGFPHKKSLLQLLLKK